MRHHAYLVEGDTTKLRQLAAAAAKLFGVSVANNPDLHVRAYAPMSVDDARELKGLAGLRGASGSKLFVLAATTMSGDVQNALLKAFEEPAPGTTFVLLVPYGLILPTLRSRMERFPISTLGYEHYDAESFAKGSYAKRSDIVSKLIKEKDKEAVRSFLGALEELLYAEKGKELAGELAEGLSDIALARKYLADRAPSLKMLLEHLAATLPRIS